MGDENSTLYHRQPEDFEVGNAVESSREGALEIDGGFVTRHSPANRTAKIVIGLEPGFHLFRMSGMEVFARQ